MNILLFFKKNSKVFKIHIRFNFKKLIVQKDFENRLIGFFSFKRNSKPFLIFNFLFLFLIFDISKAGTNNLTNSENNQIEIEYLESRNELEDYIIDTGDSISLKFFPAEELSGVFPVNEEGELFLPRLDETYVSGKERNKHASKKVKSIQGCSIKIAGNISQDSVIHTDEARMYRNLYKEYNHKTVNHGIGECVNQGSHPDTIKGAFSNFKKMIVVFITILEKHIDKYAHMFCVRFNTRELSEMKRMENLLKMTSEEISYKVLIG